MCMEAWNVLSDNEVKRNNNIHFDRIQIINKYEELTNTCNLVCFRKKLFVDLTKDNDICKVCLCDME